MHAALLPPCLLRFLPLVAPVLTLAPATQVIELFRSERSESGFKGVHKCAPGKWQTQVYHEGHLYHVGAHDTTAQCARTFAVCTQLIRNLRQRKLLVEGAAVKTGRKKRESTEALPPPGAAVESLAFDGEDAALQLHTNTKADSGCQGVYHNPHINHYGVVRSRASKIPCLESEDLIFADGLERCSPLTPPLVRCRSHQATRC